jgi:hypothetical protein
MRGGKMRVGEKSRPTPALSPKNMRLQEDASRESSTPFGVPGSKPAANRLGQRITKTLKPILPKTSLNIGIGPQKRNKRND